jgi:predicted O-methyltransferase YrrM
MSYGSAVVDKVLSALSSSREALQRARETVRAVTGADLEVEHLQQAIAAEREQYQTALKRQADELEVLRRSADAARNLNSWAPQFVPPGHFYSPVPNLDRIKAAGGDQYFVAQEARGIDLREAEQVALLDTFARFYREQPFTPAPENGRRYGLANPAYPYADGLALYSMIRHVRPKRIVEVGSGYSSCATLDTNELFFDGKIQCEFIEPYPDLLLSLIKEADKPGLNLRRSGLQDVPFEVFESLEPNDILFIDSTHVVKIGSDVTYLFFEVLPRLKRGVFVHIHDVFYPFEYPKAWILEGRTWTEIYLLRALLMYSTRFDIVYYSRFMLSQHERVFRERMPLFLKDHGGHIWLKS